MKNQNKIYGTITSDYLENKKHYDEAHDMQKLIELGDNLDDIEFYDDGVDYGEAKNQSLSQNDLRKVYEALDEMSKKVDNLKEDIPTFNKTLKPEEKTKINWIVDSFSLEEVECGIATNLYTRSYIEITPIMFLAKIGKTKALYKQIRKTPKEVNQHTITGKTALILAATYGNVNCLKLLMVAGSHIDHQDYHGSTALMFAANYGQYEIVKALLKEGANPNIEDSNGISAIYLARENKDIRIIELLSAA